MKKTLQLVGAIIGCELVGISGTVFTVSAIPAWYALLNKPSFAPPNWLFGPVWTLLYSLMGVSIYLLYQAKGPKKNRLMAINYFWAQLAVNFIWTPVFFGLRWPELALLIIVIMWGLIVQTIRTALPVNRNSAYLLLPYLAWVSFATLLNAAIAYLN